MLREILIIFLIVLTSYVFTIKSKNKTLFDPQIMFVILALTLIVLFKALYYKDINKKENFQNSENDVGSQIVKFIEGQKEVGMDKSFNMMNEQDKNQYMSSMNNLISQVSTLNQQISKINDDPTLSVSDNLNTNDRLSLESMQKMQNFQIEYLQKQIEKSKQMLQQQEIEENVNKYKPIKVYSSCAVSSADGTFSNDAVSNNTSNMSSLSGDQTQSISNMLNTISQSNLNTQEQTQTQNVLGSTLSNLLSSLNGPTNFEIN